MLTNKFALLKRDGIYKILILLSLVSVFIYTIRPALVSTLPGTIIVQQKISQINTTVSQNISKEPEENITALYYRHVIGERNSSYPYISGDTYRSMADYVFDETKIDSLASVKSGDIVFLKGDMLDRFFGNPYASISQPFVLVSHNSDFYVPEGYAKYLDDKKILAWYGSNPDRLNHPKLIPIPIGFANRRWYSGNLTKLEYAFKHYRKPWSKRTTVLYVNFAVGNNRQERGDAMAQAQKVPNVRIVKTTVSFETYLQQLGDAKFVLSPPGNGLDCHRTWEVMLMGAVPVVRSSPLDPLFANTSAVIVKTWPELTEALLLSYNRTTDEHLVPSVMSARYWRERLRKHGSMRWKFQRESNALLCISLIFVNMWRRNDAGRLVLIADLSINW